MFTVAVRSTWKYVARGRNGNSLEIEEPEATELHVMSLASARHRS